MKSFHPGETIKESLSCNGITLTQLAQTMMIQETLLTQICEGNDSITAVIAHRLSRALGLTAEYWMTLQSDYDLNETRTRELWNELEQITPLVSREDT